MCDPISLGVASTALGIGSAVSEYTGGQAAYKANKQQANLQFANTSNTISTQANQLSQQESDNALKTAILSAQTEGRIANSAADRGVGGSSLVQAINAGMFGIGVNASNDSQNITNERQQLSENLSGAGITRQSQINSVTRPNDLSLLLGIGKAGLQGASTFAGVGGKFPSLAKAA